MNAHRAVVAAAISFVSVAALAAAEIDGAAGRALFNRVWIAAPSSTDASDGLGPLFNARSCATCHAKGGGARIVTRPDGRRELLGAVVRFGDAQGVTDPVYGLQLQTDAVPGMQPEGSAQFLPRLSFDLEGQALADGIKAGVRLAPPLAGRAAFDTVTDDEIATRADPEDQDRDGISGRVNRLQADGKIAIGRFGWKAAHSTLPDQIAHAFAIDIGLSSPRQPKPWGDCTAQEAKCLAAPNGESPLLDGRELSAQMIGLVASYLETLRPPLAPQDSRAAELFRTTGCAACHVPALTSKSGAPVPAFTDLLLHDMGPELDDGAGEPGVASSEWRTAPLIGRGLNAGAGRYLHDGSAATISAAVQRHGGEANTSRQAFQRLTARDRKRLVDYVGNL